MGIHGKASNFKIKCWKRTNRQQRKLLKKKKVGHLNEDDFSLDPRTILKRRKTNPRAPSDLSGKKRNKLRKLVRHHQREEAERKRKLKQNDAEMKDKAGTTKEKDVEMKNKESEKESEAKSTTEKMDVV